MANALGVTLDNLVKDAEYQNIDQDALERLELIEKLPQDERSHLFATKDAFFAKNKLKDSLNNFKDKWRSFLSKTSRFLGYPKTQLAGIKTTDRLQNQPYSK